MLPRPFHRFAAYLSFVGVLATGAAVHGQTSTVPRLTTPADPLTHFEVEPPQLDYAQAAAILEVGTDTVLFELRGTEPWPPASLTKLVTIYTALAAAEEGRFDLQGAAPVSPGGYASAVPPGSSLMFLGPDQMVNGMDLLRGLAISSGNDAAVEVAVRVSGSVEAFLTEMNRTARRLGYDSFHFEDAAGLSAENRVTAIEVARFARDLITRWPWLTDEVFSLEEFTYPESRHYPSGGGGGAIRQFNRNGLVGTMPSVDGLKTGFIEESGYNIAVSAVRDGRRLIAVVLGVDASTHSEGGTRRETDARSLLEWGFARYENTTLVPPPVESIRLWGADRRTATPTTPPPVEITVPRGEQSMLSGTVEQLHDVWAPVEPGQSVGTVRYTLGETVIREAHLTLEREVARGNLFRRAIDRIRWWLQGVFGTRTRDRA